MSDIEKLQEYLVKLKKTIVDRADFKVFNKAIVKKNILDDILCVTIAVLPESFKNTLTRKLNNIDEYPSVSMFNRLLKLLKPRLFFLPYYVIQYGEVGTLIEAILKNITVDIERLEHASGEQ